MNPSQILAQQHKFELQKLRSEMDKHLVEQVKQCIAAANTFYQQRAALTFEALRRNVRRSDELITDGELDPTIEDFSRYFLEVIDANAKHFASERMHAHFEAATPQKTELIV